MARPKGSKNKQPQESNKPEPEKEQPKEKEQFLTIYEAAQHFKVTESAIKTWIDHGHLIKVRGGLIPMTSILRCRFNVRKIK